MMYLIHLGYLGYDQDAQTAFIPNEEIRQELTAATRRNPKNISVSLRNYNKNIADKTVLSSRKDENTMKYDFTTILDRKGKDSIAVEPFEADWIKWPGKTKEGFDIIPMWVADMNFPAVHTIPEAIIERTKHTTYGYFSPREEYFDAIIKWHKTRNGIEGLEPKHIGYENGVLGGLLSALNVFCSKGDHVLLNSPTYIGFTKSLANNGYRAVHSPLYLDEEMYARGFEFVPVDLYKAKAKMFQIVDGKLMPSFASIEGMGDKAAEAVEEAGKDGPYLSLDDFRQRTKVSKTVIDLMSELGLFGNLPKSNQLSLFDF